MIHFGWTVSITGLTDFIETALRLVPFYLCVSMLSFFSAAIIKKRKRIISALIGSAIAVISALMLLSYIYSRI